MTAIQRIVLGSVALLFSALTLLAADQTTPTNDVAALLKDLRPPDQLARYKDLVIPSNGQTIESPLAKQGEMSLARAAIERAKAIVPALRKAIKPGTSVFDYPGLLARGTISYDEHARKYRCYVGVYLLSHEGREPYDFWVVFDEKGQIEEVQDVVHKE